MGTERSGETGRERRVKRGHKVDGDSRSASARETSRRRQGHTKEERKTYNKIDTQEMMIPYLKGGSLNAF
jgi:hypothetical protein